MGRFLPIRRFLSRRGYGVQSPFAYHIVRHVIGEQAPFYAYEALRKRYGKTENERFLRLIFRITNEVQPDRCQISPALCNDIIKAYLHASCHKTAFFQMNEPVNAEGKVLFLAADVQEAEGLFPLLSTDSCLIIADTHTHQNLWKSLCNRVSTERKNGKDQKSPIVFDCGRHAVIFSKPRMAAAVYYL